MIGRNVGNYRLIKPLGQGGMGVVYLAEHPRIGRRAAVKFLHPELARNKRLLRRFFNEARAAAAVRHPGIVEVYDFGTAPDGASYITMEYLDGESLSARLGRMGKLPVALAVDIAIQVASALGAVHTKKIIHRDLKPDNLFLVPDPRGSTREIAKVLDFGIARLDHGPSEHSSIRTQTGSVMGTPVYMSPEQCRGRPDVDLRTDIYSLGVVLYEMLCGAPPFVSESFGELVYLQIGTSPPPPRTHNPDVPAALETVVMRMLAKDPEQRFSGMAELAAALQQAFPRVATGNAVAQGSRQAAEPVAARPRKHTTLSSTAGDMDGGERPNTRTRLAIVGGGLAALGGVVLLVRGPLAGYFSSSDAVPTSPAPSATSRGAASATSASSTRPAMASPPIVQPLPLRPAAPDATVAVEITTWPPGASVLDQSGQLLDFTPYSARHPARPGTARLRLEKEGFRTIEVRFPGDRALTRHFTLRRVLD